jgi:RHS repeat-associated protein
LSRLTSETYPEAGTTTSGYDSCSAGDLCTRMRPRENQTNPAVTTTTSYTYDALHRLTGKGYNDGLTNNVAFLYDQTAPWGWNILNPKGNLTEEYTATSSGAIAEQMFERDSMGRIVETGSCTPINCSANAYHFVYTYDLLGNLRTENNDREGVTYTNSYNAAAQLTNFQSSLVNSGHPGTLYTVNQYNPLGEVTQATFGNGIVRNATYDNRGRITSQTDGSLYSFSLGLAPNSDVLTGNDSVNGNWTYSYDDFNRLGTSTQASGSAFNYKYDQFGNRWQQNLTAGSGGPQPSYLFNANNQSTSFSYDAAGNVLNDGSHNYSYDAEGHMLTVDGGSTATYIYDASGQRVEETVNGGAPTDFIYDQQGHAVTEATATVWDRSELYAGGSHVALYANGTTYFMHTDWLGSTKNQSDMSGNSAQWCSYLPFADGFDCPGSQLDLMNFTGDQWDGETYLSHTLFRQYNPFQGRWMTPDPAGMAAADPTNPQSWNRYAYVMNNPLGYVDPLGLQPPPVPQRFNPFVDTFRCEFYVNVQETEETTGVEGFFCGGSDQPFYGPSVENANCILTIQANNKAGLTTNQLQTAEKQIANLLNSVAVNFVASGPKNYTLNFVNANRSNSALGVQTSFLFFQFSPNVFVNNIYKSFPGQPFSTINNIIGTVGAHELIHRITGTGDLPFDPNNPTDLMNSDNNSNAGSLFVHNGFQLTQSELQKLLNVCQQKEHN